MTDPPSTRMATYDGTFSRALVPNPLTGEVIDLVDAPDVELAEFIENLDNARAAVQDAKRIVSDEAIRRMDVAAMWTLRAGPYQMRTASPEPEELYGEKRRIEYQNGAALREALNRLVDEKLISVEAADAAVETVVLYKVRKGGVLKLLKLGGKVAQTVREHAFHAEKRRYVSVERA